MGRLRSGSTQLLVATDVAARGLDVDHLTHVFNYGLPTAAEQYVHRIGRVGRAGRTGIAITIAEPREKRRIKDIERLTKLPVSVEEVPTVEALKKKRLLETKAALLEVLEQDGNESEMVPFEAVVDSLSSKLAPADIAAAALKLAHEARGRPIDETAFSPVANQKKDKRTAGGRGGGKPGGKSNGPPAGDRTRLFFSVGRNAKVSPKDLVGAIANEGGLSGKQIGPIEVKENFSLVEVPSAAADGVVRSMRSSRIKGRKATIRRERF